MSKILLYTISIFIIFIAIVISVKFLNNKKNIREIEKTSTDFWLNKVKSENDIVLNKEQIKEFNKNIESSFDLTKFPEILDKDFILKKINDKILFENPIKDTYYNFPEIKSKNGISYGISIDKVNLRIIPTNEPFFEEKGDRHFDLYQEKEVKTGEGLIIMHYTIDKKWAFVQTNNTDGWIETKYIANTTKDEFVQYFNNQEFVIVISKQVKLNNKILDMSSKFNIAEKNNNDIYINLPNKDKNGNLILEKIKVENNEDFNIGYLDYTKHNVIKQAFKYYHTPYGWGGLYNGIDCSGFISNVYSVFGFNMPRNSNQLQALAGKYITIPENISESKRNEILDRAKIGNLLYMKGHIMIYLGKYNGNYYAIHSLSSTYENKKKIKVMNTVITDLDLVRKNGATLRESLLSITFMEF